MDLMDEDAEKRRHAAMGLLFLLGRSQEPQLEA